MTQLINLEKLNEFAEQDTELIGELAIIFAREVPSYLAKLRLAVLESNPKELRETSHQLKSQLSYFFCESLIKIAFELEELGKAGETKPAVAMIEELTADINRLMNELRQLTGIALTLEES